MKNEIEARLLEVDYSKFVEKLNGVGAQLVGDYLQLRYCYDFSPVKENSWIRLRTNGKETTLTIKEICDGSIDGTKELEILVSSFAETDRILNKLGYNARSKQENRRIKYLLDGVEIDIDFWPYIPTYVEFEGKNVREIKSVCEKLNVPFNDLVTLDVASIYAYYGHADKMKGELCLEEERRPQEELEG